MQVFHELTPECDRTAQLYAYGYEKKEIAEMKCRADSTINNQLQTAFIQLSVRNGRELTRKFYSRLSSLGISMDYKPQLRSFIACGMICLLMSTIFSHNDYRRPRRIRMVRTERRIDNGS